MLIVTMDFYCLCLNISVSLTSILTNIYVNMLHGHQHMYPKDKCLAYCSTHSTPMSVAGHNPNAIYKFAGDPTVVVRITDGDKKVFRREMDQPVGWCNDNNLALNISKDLNLNFRRKSGELDPVLIEGSVVDRVKNFKFLGVNIFKDLSWSLHVDEIKKKDHQQLDFVRCLRQFCRSLKTLVDIYRWTVESSQAGCITAWYRGANSQDKNKLQRVVNLQHHGHQTPLHRGHRHEVVSQESSLYRQGSPPTTPPPRPCPLHSAAIGKEVQEPEDELPAAQGRLLPLRHQIPERATTPRHSLTFRALLF
ncbi:uncharacterized protein [Narcine bancroftii]|uniref:uncharacterized protein n=1 Tax=Narcine bancroftii TaxID=1343680 RepID=UPI0038317F60